MKRENLSYVYFFVCEMITIIFFAFYRDRYGTEMAKIAEKGC